MTNPSTVPPRSHPPVRFRLEFPPELPITARAEEITAAIGAHQVVILAGETGSGKTTQIPKMCLAAGRGTKGRIACTQPRRVAALSVSRRVAEELGVEWGGVVGAKIRFSDQTTSQTVIKFLTDGMLLAEVQGDPMLRDYDTIIIDEAHERSLNIDFLLGHLRTLRYQRPDLKIIVTSATIDTAMFSAAFDDAPVIQVEGRTFPVEVIYAPLDGMGSDYAENDENEEKDDKEAVASAKAEALHYIDGAVEAVERIVRESEAGDILVFLPSERDIRELSDLLEGRLSSIRGAKAEIVPLFGRLTNSEQQRVFAPTPRRKIVLATNLAETSLTIPGIRFVVDTGLARLSRYSPQARTRRLPIEPVSQSSADQRKGRSGRVADGVCIRLYSEKDFLERPRFTQPEIQRANLADVILRLKAFGLGDIERFPFINMPAAKSIRAGYALLDELGAIEEERAVGGALRPDKSPESGDKPPPTVATRQLTSLGRELARLPVDPTVGRMILQARAEKAVREVLVIAAGLSIQDPRERPLEKQQQADAAHRRFAHPDSDFLTLLNVWDAWHDQFENLSQARLRRFCRDHFLSYTRMREWRDVHAQLFDVLREREDFKLTSALHGCGAGFAPATKSGRMAGANPAPQELAFGSPGYRAIHRSILAGLLGNIATLDEENGGYKATNDRRVALFPGSVLFKRDDAKKKSKDAAQRDAQKNQPKAARWIMASEIMETSKLYARTCARLDPLWALDLGAHIARVAHSEPFWNESAGRVMVKRRTRLYGLELESRAVSYGKIEPEHATEIFIREALVNDTVFHPLDFIAHNRAIREKVEDALTRARDSGYLNVDEAAYRFYAARLLGGVGASLDDARAPSSGAPTGISSVAELVDLVRERRGAEPKFLMMSADDLRDPATIAVDAEAFPAALPLDNRALPLNYAYKPGQADDGVTLDVSVREAEALTPAALDWAVPGHLAEKVEHYLRATPKDVRRLFVPLAEAAKSLAEDLRRGGPARPRAGMRDTGNVNRANAGTGTQSLRSGQASSPPTLTVALAAQIAERFRISLDPAVWNDKPLPDHLRVRVRVVDDKGRELAASRELAEIDAALHAQKRTASAAVARVEPEAWRRARAQWESPAHIAWNFGEFPERVLVTEQAGVPVFAYPGLQAHQDGPDFAKASSGGVALQLFKTPEEAAAATRTGLAALFERQLSHDLGWLERDLRAVRMLGPLLTTLAPADELQAHAFESIRRWLCDPKRVAQASSLPTSELQAGSLRYLTAAAFAAALEKAKADLRGLVPRFCDLLKEIMAARQELLVQPKPYAGLDADLAALIPPDFLRTTPYAQLAHFPRYLKAMKLRADRWRQNPAKDTERAAQLAPYITAVAKMRARDGADAFRWLVEEFRVSLFAQELGTAEPVSAVKLDRALATLQSGTATPRVETAAAAPAPKPIVSAPVAAKKSTPLKNLGALDKLFPR